MILNPGTNALNICFLSHNIFIFEYSIRFSLQLSLGVLHSPQTNITILYLELVLNELFQSQMFSLLRTPTHRNTHFDLTKHSSTNNIIYPQPFGSMKRNLSRKNNGSEN